MQFLVSVIDHTSSSATPEEMESIHEFNRRIRDEGRWVFAGGLAAPGTAVVIDDRGSEAVATDGPFVETQEHVAGVWILEAPDRDTAVELATEASRACNRRVEVRAFL